MCMNIRRYMDILDQFKLYHPYLADGVADWEPISGNSIRVTMNDGSEYDFHAMSNTVRNVKDRPAHRDETFDEEEWRLVFADRLAEYMGTRGISQQALADYTGLGKGSINNYLNGRATPSGYALTKLARALNCTVMDLTY